MYFNAYLALIKHDIGGNYVLNELTKSLDKKGVVITPFYKFNKNIIDNQILIDYLPNVVADPSYESFCKRETIRDMKETSLAVLEDLSSKFIPNKVVEN